MMKLLSVVLVLQVIDTVTVREVLEPVLFLHAFLK